jgi:hypothetical protein
MRTLLEGPGGQLLGTHQVLLLVFRHVLVFVPGIQRRGDTGVRDWLWLVGRLSGSSSLSGYLCLSELNRAKQWPLVGSEHFGSVRTLVRDFLSVITVV